MIYSVFSIGDAEMLYNAFQGAAMIFNSGGMTNLLRTGFLLGSFLAGLRYLTTQKFDIHHILAAIIIYEIMFWPKVTVSIEDAYTAEVRAVANVPLGVALPMSIITTMGYRLTQAYEAAFSVPQESSMLQNGYIDSLRTLLKLRYIGAGTAGSDVSFNGDLGRSINQYIDTCVRFDLELVSPVHEVTRQGLKKSPDLWAAMKTTFVNRDILVYLPLEGYQNGKQENCMDAYEHISAYIDGPGSDFGPLWDAYLKGLLGIEDASDTSSDKVQRAITALGMTSTDAQTYMMNALMASYLRDGPAAVIQRTGMEQLQTQWAGEQGLFRQVARPIMAFVETFTVASAPIAAFLLTLGPVGISLAARYLQLIAWISLWGPVMAVCNMYITIVSSRALATLASHARANGADIASMVMHDEVYRTLETWVATGGMLAASVPAISLMLVYGGTVAATNLAGRMTSGVTSNVNAKALSPDAVQNAPAMQVSPQMAYSPNTGSSKAGVQQPTYNLTSGAERGMQSARTALHSASSQVSQTQSQMLQSATRSGHTTRDADSVSSALSHSNSSADRYAATAGRQIGDRVGASDVEKRAISTALATNVGAGLGVKGTLWGLLTPAEVHAGVEANLSSAGSTDASRNRELATQATQLWQDEHANSDEFRQAKDYATQHSNESIFASENMQAHAKQYQSQLTNVQTASEQYQRSAALKETAGHAANVDYSNLARKLVNSNAINELGVYDAQMSRGSEQEKADWDKRLRQAGKQIDNSGFLSGNHIGGLERTTLQQFLALDSQDPAAATKIAAQALLPASGNRLGDDIRPEAFQRIGRSPEEVFRPEAANAAKEKAEGQGPVTPPASSAQAPAGQQPQAPASPPASPASHHHREPVPSTNPDVREFQDWMKGRKDERRESTGPATQVAASPQGPSAQTGGGHGQANVQSHVERPDSQAFFRSRIEKGPVSAPAPVNNEQFDKTRQQIEDKNLGHSARANVKNAGGDVVQGVGKAWEKDMIDPVVNTVKLPFSHVGNLLGHDDKTTSKHDSNKLEIDVSPKK